MGDFSCDIELPFFKADGRGVGTGFGTLKLVWKRTWSRVEADPKGSAVGIVDAFLVGTEGSGLGPSGFTVACILASEDAVGA